MGNTVVVTGIGGVVGQGIIRNIRKLAPSIRIVGTNVTPFSAGNHLVDDFELVPYAYDAGYIPRMQEILSAHAVDVLLPSTDFETFYLSKAVDVLQTRLVCSDVRTTETYLDKYLSFQHHEAHGIPFASSFLPSEYRGEFEETVVKPRTGRGSREIHFNPEDISSFDDKTFLVQEWVRGVEITTPFYVNKQGELHGFITFERQLQHGATNECRVVSCYDHRLRPILESMVTHGHFLGSANLQSIVTSDGRVVPFEVNCRISGTNSIRAHFGFEDIKYALQEHLWEEAPERPQVRPGVAVRILLDVIYPDQENFEGLSHRGAPHHVS